MIISNKFYDCVCASITSKAPHSLLRMVFIRYVKSLEKVIRQSPDFPLCFNFHMAVCITFHQISCEITDYEYRGSPPCTVSTNMISTSTNFSAIGIKFVLVELLFSKIRTKINSLYQVSILDYCIARK